MKKISKVLAAVLMAAGLAILSTSGMSYAAKDPICDNDLPADIKESLGCDLTGDEASAAFSNTIVNIINAVLGVIGIVAVIFIVYGGVLYLTSGGDPSKTKKGKDALLYAAFGLIVVGLAYAIVNFVVINIVNKA
ncbi:hypothetical protein IKX64_00255 [Candidatus Saccharibacteria bacterium]|nr:hypothetical protein [Candidatus Saccharibacteria bacterium]